MLMLSRVCVCLGVSLLMLTGPSRSMAGVNYICLGYKDCAANNCPSCYCTFSSGRTFKVCTEYYRYTPCRNQSASTGTTCYGTDLTGSTCTVFYYDCT